MARPERNSVDYFPFLIEEGKKMFYLEETYGNDGFAVFVKLLRELAKTDYHYLDLSKTTTTMFLSAKCKVSKNTLELIVNDLVDLEKFDSVLWKENRVIWCPSFIDSIQDAYSKRKNKCITYDGLLLLLISLGVRKHGKSDSKECIKPQSIVEYNKEEKRKQYYIIEDYLNNENLLKAIKKNHKLSDEQFDNYFNDFKCNYLGHKLSEDKFVEAQRHFNNWIKSEIRREKKYDKKESNTSRLLNIGKELLRENE